MSGTWTGVTTFQRLVPLACAVSTTGSLFVFLRVNTTAINWLLPLLDLMEQRIIPDGCKKLILSRFKNIPVNTKCTPENPCLLVIDNHGSHLSNFAESNGVITLSFPHIAHIGSSLSIAQFMDLLRIRSTQHVTTGWSISPVERWQSVIYHNWVRVHSH